MNAQPLNIVDGLDEVHCRVAFLQAATWAFSSMTDGSCLPNIQGWMGLGYIITDLERQIKTLHQRADELHR